MSCPEGLGKEEKRIYHREVSSRNRIGNAQYGGHGQVVPNSMPTAAASSVKKFVILPSWGCISFVRIAARSVLLLMVLAIFPFFCAKPNSNSVAESDHGIGNTVSSNQVLFQWPSHTLSVVFQDMVSEGLLKKGDRALCIGIGTSPNDEKLGIDMVFEEDIQNARFPYNSFDFELGVTYSSFTAAEVDRTLKIGGVAAVHLSLAEPGLNLNTLLQLHLPNFKIVYLRKFDAFGLDTVIAFRKVHRAPNPIKTIPQKAIKCPLNAEKRAAMKKLEHILLEQPRASWIESHENLNNIQYLPNILGYPQNSTGYVFVDVGANSYKSSIGSWFQSHYPKHNHKFDIFAIEADGSFGTEYLDHPEVKFLPFAAWIKNEVQSEQSRERGLDLAEWLVETVTPEDYVVMKMNVGGAEFQILPKMLRTGALCLVDELFLECHYQSPYKKKKQRRSYWECLTLYGLLRENGVAVHQWWG
ncbi:hypothetical protein KI387_010214 [Taxus chinensis]|uniref:DUF7870 domain-containing protein n=1 Tax=Taxus chinensis TaxID=29808 RepID=A0AA38KUE4_TAXCH|nr:hypothetical protein KI387_010214 [Taxus chinensis]